MTWLTHWLSEWVTRSPIELSWTAKKIFELTTGSNFGFWLSMCTTMSKFGFVWEEGGLRIMYPSALFWGAVVVQSQLVDCEPVSYCRAIAEHIGQTCWASLLDLNPFDRLQRACLLLFHCYWISVKLGLVENVDILRNPCTFFFFGQAEGGFLISKRDSWSRFWTSY